MVALSECADLIQGGAVLMADWSDWSPASDVTEQFPDHAEGRAPKRRRLRNKTPPSDKK